MGPHPEPEPPQRPGLGDVHLYWGVANFPAGSRWLFCRDYFHLACHVYAQQPDHSLQTYPAGRPRFRALHIVQQLAEHLLGSCVHLQNQHGILDK